MISGIIAYIIALTSTSYFFMWIQIICPEEISVSYKVHSLMTNYLF